MCTTSKVEALPIPEQFCLQARLLLAPLLILLTQNLFLIKKYDPGLERHWLTRTVSCEWLLLTVVACTKK